MTRDITIHYSKECTNTKINKNVKKIIQRMYNIVWANKNITGWLKEHLKVIKWFKTQTQIILKSH